MFELTRALLRSIGPEGARFENVLLDFTGADDAPALATVLHLENGGGKSVMLKTLFSVMLSERRHTLGADADQRTLDDYVLNGDVGHVVLEWRDSLDGHRLITAKVTEWQGRRVSTDPSKLQEMWYSFTPSDEVLGLDTLPFTEGERRVLLSNFREQLRNLSSAHPELNLAIVDRKRDWPVHLASVGLDPELFIYQVKMNANEGQADKAYQFASDEAFVEFLLGAVMDPGGADTLAAAVAEYSEQLSKREYLELVVRFCEGALTFLEPLEEAYDAHEQAARHRREAERFARQAHAEMATAAHEAAEEHTRLTEQASQEEARRANAETRTRDLRGWVEELRRRIIRFELDDAEAVLKIAADALAEAQAELSAWSAVDRVARERDARATLEALSVELAAAQREAMPLRERRDGSATALAGVLRGLAEQASQDAAGARTQAKRAGDAAQDADARERAEVKKAAEARAERGAAERELAAIERERQKLVAGAVLAEGQSAQAALDELDRLESQAETTIADTERRIDDYDKRRDELAESARRASTRANEEQRAAGEAERVLETLRERVATLNANERLRAVAGVSALDILSDIRSALPGLLVEAIAQSEQALVDLEVSVAEDRRAGRSLDETGLLPAHRDVERVVETLRHAGINSVPGWRYLNQAIAADRRAEVLARQPALAAGVTLGNSSDLARAREVLEAAALDPVTLVCVAPGERLRLQVLADPSSSTEPPFVVSPHEALYDETAGEVERAAHRERLDSSDEHRRELTNTASGDRRVASELDAVLSDCPPSHLEGLETAWQRHLDLGAASRAEAKRHNDEREAVAGERDRARQTLQGARQQLRSVEARRPRIERYAERASTLEELRRVERDSQTELDRAETAARHAGEESSRHRGEEREAHRRADQAGTQALALRAEATGVHGAAEGTAARALADGETLAGLKAAWRVADEQLRAATSDSVIAARHRDAEQQAKRALADVQALAPTIREQASWLLDTPDGADPAARRQSHERCQRGVARREEERRGYQREVDRLTDMLPSEPGRAARFFPPELVPSDLAHAEQLRAQTQAELDAANLEVREAQQARDDANRGRDQAGARGRLLQSVARAIRSSLETVGADVELASEVAAFAGSDEDAQAVQDEVGANLREAVRQQQGCERRMEDCQRKLQRFAMQAEFSTLEGPLRQRLGREDISAEAGQNRLWVAERAQESSRQLASIERHRDSLIMRLRSLVDEAFSVVRGVRSASRLPDGLGDWSHQEFLRISFDMPPSEDIRNAKLGEAIDRAAESRARTGMALVMAGVHAWVEPRGFAVSMLKPNAGFRQEYMPVTSMSGKFSGGMRLTAAIVIYCTLASLRASKQNRLDDRAGVLILDNPFGTANADWLLDIQLKVAERVGVQLVFTTGLNDENALSPFPRIIQLRNDQNIRSAMQCVHIAADIRNAITLGRDEADERGYVDAVALSHTAASS